MSNQTHTLANVLADIIVNGALEFMAAKAGVTIPEILDTIQADPQGNAARYFSQLVTAGANNIDTVLDEVRAAHF